MKNFIKEQVSSAKQSFEAIAPADGPLTGLDTAVVAVLIVLSFSCGFAVVSTVLQIINS